MKRNSLTILVGVLLLVIFGLLLFTFQVRQTEIALVTTFDKPTRYITEPGFQLKWPRPIQRVYKFDRRIQTLDFDKVDESLTKDSFNVVVQVYMEWSITKPDVFFSSFPSGTVSAAQPALEDMIRGAKQEVIGKHAFSDFVSTDPKQLKFSDIEKEMLQYVQPIASKSYGIEVKFLGIKKLGLPESVTQKVFERMMSERKRVQSVLDAEGQTEAKKIKSNADVEVSKILAAANAQATAIKGEADAEAAASYAVFNLEPDLANFFYKLKALEEIGKQRTSYFLDPRTTPFDLLTTNFWLKSGGLKQPPTLATNGVLPMIEGKATVSTSKDAP
jgi:membrane protease subunit HflC